MPRSFLLRKISLALLPYEHSRVAAPFPWFGKTVRLCNILFMPASSPIAVSEDMGKSREMRNANVPSKAITLKIHLYTRLGISFTQELSQTKVEFPTGLPPVPSAIR